MINNSIIYFIIVKYLLYLTLYIMLNNLLKYINNFISSNEQRKTYLSHTHF